MLRSVLYVVPCDRSLFRQRTSLAGGHSDGRLRHSLPALNLNPVSGRAPPASTASPSIRQPLACQVDSMPKSCRSSALDRRSLDAARARALGRAKSATPTSASGSTRQLHSADPLRLPTMELAATCAIARATGFGLTGHVVVVYRWAKQGWPGFSARAGLWSGPMIGGPVIR